jgi:hypothetical protein
VILRASLVLPLSLAVAACAAQVQTGVDPSAIPDRPTLQQSTLQLSAPDGWSSYRDEANGFALAYPQTTSLPSSGGEAAFYLTLPTDPSTNVIEETIAVRIVPPGQPCASPLGSGFAPEELEPTTVELGGLAWLRQSRSGVAAGTASTWVAYSASRKDRCLSLDYTLRTFDPASLDPTRFPTPPARVEWSEREAVFEQLLASFTWLR